MLLVTARLKTGDVPGIVNREKTHMAALRAPGFDFRDMLDLIERIRPGQHGSTAQPSACTDAVILSKTHRKAAGGNKDNQRKWFRDGIWYKADFLGYEGLAEYISSCLLGVSDIPSFIRYSLVCIQEADEQETNVFIGCMSHDFGTIITGDVIILQLPEKYNVWLNPTGTFADDLQVFCEGVELVFGVNVERNMRQMLCFDLIVGNEDRILRNFGLQQTDTGFVFAPLFDHGLSLLADTKSPERVTSLSEISYRPFDYSRFEGIRHLSGTPLTFDIARFDELVENIPYYPRETVNRALTVLRESLEETEGKLWIRA